MCGSIRLVKLARCDKMPPLPRPPRVVSGLSAPRSYARAQRVSNDTAPAQQRGSSEAVGAGRTDCSAWRPDVPAGTGALMLLFIPSIGRPPSGGRFTLPVLAVQSWSRLLRAGGRVGCRRGSLKQFIFNRSRNHIFRSPSWDGCSWSHRSGRTHNPMISQLPLHVGLDGLEVSVPAVPPVMTGNYWPRGALKGSSTGAHHGRDRRRSATPVSSVLGFPSGGDMQASARRRARQGVRRSQRRSTDRRKVAQYGRPIQITEIVRPPARRRSRLRAASWAYATRRLGNRTASGRTLGTRRPRPSTERRSVSTLFRYWCPSMLGLLAIKKTFSRLAAPLAVLLVIAPLGQHAANSVLCIGGNGHVAAEVASCSGCAAPADTESAPAGDVPGSGSGGTDGSHCGACTDIPLPAGGDADCVSFKSETGPSAQIVLSVVATLLTPRLTDTAHDGLLIQPARSATSPSDPTLLRSVVLLI